MKKNLFFEILETLHNKLEISLDKVYLEQIIYRFEFIYHNLENYIILQANEEKVVEFSNLLTNMERVLIVIYDRKPIKENVFPELLFKGTINFGEEEVQVIVEDRRPDCDDYEGKYKLQIRVVKSNTITNNYIIAHFNQSKFEKLLSRLSSLGSLCRHINEPEWSCD